MPRKASKVMSQSFMIILEIERFADTSRSRLRIVLCINCSATSWVGDPSFFPLILLPSLFRLYSIIFIPSLFCPYSVLVPSLFCPYSILIPTLFHSYSILILICLSLFHHANRMIVTYFGAKSTLLLYLLYSIQSLIYLISNNVQFRLYFFLNTFAHMTHSQTL